MKSYIVRSPYVDGSSPDVDTRLLSTPQAYRAEVLRVYSHTASDQARCARAMLGMIDMALRDSALSTGASIERCMMCLRLVDPGLSDTNSLYGMLDTCILMLHIMHFRSAKYIIERYAHTEPFQVIANAAVGLWSGRTKQMRVSRRLLCAPDMDSAPFDDMIVGAVVRNGEIRWPMVRRLLESILDRPCAGLDIKWMLSCVRQYLFIV